MQFLFITGGNLLSTAKRVELEGNEVAVYDPSNRVVGDGYIPVIKELTLRPDTVVVFDCSGQGKLADALRSEGWAIVGGGQFNDRIEQDYRQTAAMLRLASIPTGIIRAVETVEEGVSVMAEHPQLQVLRKATNRREVVYPGSPASGPFVVTEAQTGPEEYFGGFFNGSDWIFGGFHSGVVERNFMTGGLGSDVGYAGGISFFYKHARPAMVKSTLLRLSRFLAQKQYRGPVGVWTVNDRAVGLSMSFEPGIWNSLSRLISGDLGRWLADLARGQTRKIRVSTDYSAGVLVSVPPYPGGWMPSQDRQVVTPPMKLGLDFHPLDQSAGKVGYVTYQAGSVSQLTKLYDQVKQVTSPGLQYRTDVVAPSVQARVRSLLRRVAVEGPNRIEMPVDPLTGEAHRFISDVTENYAKREV